MGLSGEPLADMPLGVGPGGAGFSVVVDCEPQPSKNAAQVREQRRHQIRIIALTES
jgi:hypothetical protein